MFARSAEVSPGREGTGYDKKNGPLKFVLTGIDYSHPYQAERGIEEETAIEFGVGFYPGPGLMQGRLVIPIHNAGGELIAYCGRSVDQMQLRYGLPPAFTKSEILLQHAARGRQR